MSGMLFVFRARSNMEPSFVLRLKCPSVKGRSFRGTPASVCYRDA